MSSAARLFRLSIICATVVVFGCSIDHSPTAPQKIKPGDHPSRIIEYGYYNCDGAAWDCRDIFTYELIASLWAPQMTSYCQTYPDTCSFSYDGGGGYANPTVSEPTLELEDDPPDTPKPTCSPLPSEPHARAWCVGSAPNTQALTRINAAIQNIRNLGGICATLADILTAVVSRGDLHVFDGSGFAFGASAPQGGGASGPNSWITLSNYWTTFSYDNGHVTLHGTVQRTLQEVLAHEADHLNGIGPHSDPDGYTTPNSQHCGGF